MGMELITGYKGSSHVTSEQAGAENAGIVGDGRYVFDVGEKFNIEIISNNLIRIKNGYGINQGRVFGITQADYEELIIDNGLAGVGRNDLVVARYQKVVETGIESVSLVVIKGTSSATPVDPTYNTGSILNGAIIDDYPLYRIVLSGLSISLVVQLFQVVKPVTEILNLVDMIATEYSSDNTYVLGEYHHYNGVLYKCTTPITNPETWNASKWTVARIGNELKIAKDDISTINTNLTNGNSLKQTIYGTINGVASSVEYNKRGNCLYITLNMNSAITAVAGTEYALTGAVLPVGYRPLETYTHGGIIGQSGVHVAGYVKVKSTGEVSVIFVNAGSMRSYNTDFTVFI